MELNITKEKYLEICKLANEQLQMIIQTSFISMCKAQDLFYKTIEIFKSTLDKDEYLVFKSKLFFPSNYDFIIKSKNAYYSKELTNSNLYKDKLKQIQLEQKLFNIDKNKYPTVSDVYNEKINFSDVKNTTKYNIVSNVNDLFLEVLIKLKNDNFIQKKYNSISYDFISINDIKNKYHKFLINCNGESKSVINRIFDQYVFNPFNNHIINSYKKKKIR